MTYKLGVASQLKLIGVNPILVSVAECAIRFTPVDFSILWGWRGEADQTLMVKTKVSKTPWPLSKHNVVDANHRPASMAIDFAPWIKGDIPWDDTHTFAVIAGVWFASFAAIREEHPTFAEGYVLRWGGDWDRDGSTRDQTFMDWGHLELVKAGSIGAPITG
jgi:peptidoglycan L-alanyl-D-glutamate endopeptidase CwlK